MKVSLNLAQQFSNVDLKSIAREELLQRIGAQLGAIEDVTDWLPVYEGAVIVKVVSCEKHPNADKLSVCQVDDGSGQAVQVVCGAPNVHAGMFAVWLKPGVTVPSTRATDPFVLEAREIRGEMSNGMLASAKELAISDDHDGIVEVSPEEAGGEPTLGAPLTHYFGLDDLVIDLENKMFTHRPDGFGNLGVARELAGIAGLTFQSPDWYAKVPEFDPVDTLPLTIKNQAQELVPRLMAVAMNGITVKKSPVWLQALLTRVGIKPINNVVDVTNYVMQLTGQPLHAFDYDKISACSTTPGIQARVSQKGEKLTLLGQKEVELTGEEIVIATDKQAVALAGIMGGVDTEVDETTKNIIIECATFDMYSVRRTSMRHGIFTEAVTRFTKGQSPLQNDRALAFAMEQMNKLAGAQQASTVADVRSVPADTYDSQSLSGQLSVQTQFINERLGADLNDEEICFLLRNVEFDAKVSEGGQGLMITAPFWRTDIEQPEDLVEEVGRLHGYDKLPVSLPPRSSKPTPKNLVRTFKQQIREQLSAAGANEVLTYSFVHGELLKKIGIDAEKWTYHLRNALSPDLQYYRPSVIPSLLAKVHPNIKAQAGNEHNHFALFEIGKAHVKGELDDEKLPEEMQRLALVITADDKTASSFHSGAAFYLAKKYVDVVTRDQASYLPFDNSDIPVIAPFAKERSAIVAIQGTKVGVVGEFAAHLRNSLKLPRFTAGFELDIELLREKVADSLYKALSPYPVIQQDITLEVASITPYQKVADSLQTVADKAQEGTRITISPLDIFMPEASDKKRLTFRVKMASQLKTLTTEEANSILSDLAGAAANSVGAVRI